MEHTKGEWERHNAPNGEHIWCGNKHIADIVTDTDNPGWDENVNEIAKSAILMHNDPKYKAGPDLYEVCKELLAEVKIHTTKHDLGMKALAERAKQILAKARDK